MNTYATSVGTRVTQSQIEAYVHKAKAQKIEQMLDEHGYIFCEGCEKNASAGEPIDCSHDISVKAAKEMGMTELAWDVDNIKMRCRTCHQIKDGLNLQSGKTVGR